MRYFDAHIHLGSPDRAGLDSLLRYVDGEPEMVGANLILNTAEEVELVERHLGLLPETFNLIPYFAPGTHFPAAMERTGWYKIHPRIGRFSADRVAALREALVGAAGGVKGIIVHCFPWGPELQFNTSVQIVLELACARPELPVLAAHGGGYESWILRAHAGGMRNVLFDFSVTMAYYQGADAVRPFQRYLTHSPARVLFGSDWPSAESEEQLAECARLASEVGVSGEQLESLLLENSRRLWPGRG